MLASALEYIHLKGFVRNSDLDKDQWWSQQLRLIKEEDYQINDKYILAFIIFINNLRQ